MMRILMMVALAVAMAGPALAQSPTQIKVTNDGVGRLNENTIFAASSLSAVYFGYEIQQGNTSAEGETVPIFLIKTKQGERVLEVHGELGGLVSSVIVQNSQVKTTDGVGAGTLFAKVYGEDQAPVCVAGKEEQSGSVICPAPGMPNVTYVFGGKYDGPDGTLPPEEVLGGFRVRNIVWYSPKSEG